VSIELFIGKSKVFASEGQTILQAALASGIYIPHLCCHPDLPAFDKTEPSEYCYRGEEKHHHHSSASGYKGCGLCLVHVAGKDEAVLSCTAPVESGMEVDIDSQKLKELRRENLSLLFEHHPHACLTCAQKEGCSLTQCSTNVPEEERCCIQFDVCEFRKVAEYIGLKDDISRYVPQNLYSEEDKPLFIRDYNLCIGCLRCVRVCESAIGAKALAYINEEDKVLVGTAQPHLEESTCRFCGACVEVCPTGALRDKDRKPGSREEALVPCRNSCPVKMDVPSYVHFISQQKYTEAAGVIRERVPLALTLGYICPHPCEEDCRRQKLNDPIAICDLKRFAFEKTRPEISIAAEDKTGKNIAVLGSGPAGLVASFFLAQRGHDVKVFESQPEAGGLLRWAIPEYRLPKEIVIQEIESIESMGVKIETDSCVRGEELINDLRSRKWDAVFIAVGAQENKRIEIEGIQAEGVYWGLDFLRDIKKGKAPELSGKVVVIGGGNVAMDVAMSALRMGASSVDIACLEKREEMPAFLWEIQEAEEEGVTLYPRWGPKEIKQENGKVKGVLLQSCLSVFDENGYFCPAFYPEQQKFPEADTVILAIGQSADLSPFSSFLDLQVTDDGRLQNDPVTLETSIPGLYVGGEISLGPSSAVEAMADGRKAASAIDKYLGGSGFEDQMSNKRGKKDLEQLWLGEETKFGMKKRIKSSLLPAEERLSSFKLVQKGYVEESDARNEANRCLRCHFRFYLSPVVFPPEKWLQFTQEVIDEIPDVEGVFQLLDEEKEIIQIKGTPNLKTALQKQLSSSPNARYFTFEEDKMFTKRESELMQQFLQKHGHLPSGEEEIDDLF
jgi:NADPH-dependent glutamate synthase beta subunit-like oxidoreductase/NAD-dependent dihydropyrimidine dehydrogenase PreA subunit